MKKMFVLALIISLVSCGPEAAKENSNAATGPALPIAVKDSLTSELKAIATSGPIHGFGVAIVNADGVVYSEGFGYAEGLVLTEFAI